MAQTYLPTAAVNAAIEAMFPTANYAPTASATNGSTTLTFTATEAAFVLPGMTVTGAGITSGGIVSSVNYTTGVVTISGTITTLTASKYTFSMSIFGSLHTGSPATTGANEVSGGSYVRQSVTFGVASAGVKTSTNSQSWTGMPSATVADFGFFTLSSAGTYLGGGVLSSSLTVPSGATVFAAVAAITLTAGG